MISRSTKVTQLYVPDPFDMISRRCEIIKRLALSLSAQADQDEAASLELDSRDPEPGRPEPGALVIPFRDRHACGEAPAALHEN